MDEAILRRICRDAGMPDLLEVLADRIPPTDLQTVLLETARRRASARSPAELIGHYGRDRTTRPGSGDARLLARLVVAAAREMGTQVERIDVRISDTRVHELLREWGAAPRADVEHPRDAVGRDEARRLGRRLQLLEGAVEALAPLRREFPDSRMLVDRTRTSAVTYYAGLQLQIDATVGGAGVILADRGSVDWGARLMSDRSEHLFTSGLGLERLAH